MKWIQALFNSPAAIIFLLAAVAFIGLAGWTFVRGRKSSVGRRRIAWKVAAIGMVVLAINCVVGAYQNTKIQVFFDLLRSKQDTP